MLTRRAALGTLAATPFVLRGASGTRIPVGLELYSVREGLQKDQAATLAAVAQAGYDCVEFYGTYYDWTTEQAETTRKQLDDLKLSCYSTHTSRKAFTSDKLPKAIELNKILGTKYVVMSSAGELETIAAWKQVAEELDTANKTLAKQGLHAGFHNHNTEWAVIDGQRPMDVLAANTDGSIMLQLDVGTCVAAGQDPVAWIEKNPNRIRSLHLKDWSADNGYKVLFGEGTCPWKRIFAAAEKDGGVEFYLIEQEGSKYPEVETAQRCLVAYKDIHG